MKDWIEAMLMMRPLLARNGARNACVTLNTPLRFIAMIVLPVLDHGVGVASERVAAVDAGIVDEDRDLADLACDLRRHHAAGVAVADVEREGLRLAAGFADVRGRFGRRLAIDVERGHGRALAGVAERDGAADAGACAGYDRDVILQKSGHGLSFLPAIIDTPPTITMN